MFTIQENVSLAPFTSFRIGGSARYYIEIHSTDELMKALEFSREKNIDFYILGGGTNLLVSDKGFDGLIIRMKFNDIKISDEIIVVEAGAPLIKLINFAAKNSLSGMEKMAGIPGTTGGAIRGNAGAFGVEMRSAVESVTFFDSEKLELKTFENVQCEFAYRSSIFKQNKKFIIISAKLKLKKGDENEILQKTKDTISTRTISGLHGTKSAGSFFMNPVVTNEKLCADFEKEKGVPPKNNTLPAGWVIDQAGLRGKKIGGAQICEKHANYLINADNATADDVVMLVSYVKQQVRDQFGIQLQEEVCYLGF